MNSSGYPMANSDQVSSAQTENGKDGVSILTSPPDSPATYLHDQSSSNQPESGVVRAENQSLRSQVRQLQAELQAEQDAVTAMRKRTNNIERDRLDAMSKANEEISKLDSEVARLRAQLEKGEALRQNLEYELSKLKREMNQDQHQAIQREQLLSQVNESLKVKTEELGHRLEHFREELNTTKNNAAIELGKMREELNEKDHVISEHHSQKDIIEAERDRLDAILKQKESAMKDLEDKNERSEQCKREQTDNLRRQLTENDIMKEREDRLKSDLESALNRVSALEDITEAERAAHLESKFNSEIIQLRVRDLESALELEKSSKAEVIANREQLNHQFQELKQVIENEKISSKAAQEKLQKAEKEYAALSKQLAAELDEKKAMIKRLSDQLDQHQINFNELKQELTKTRKRQVYLEETYSGSMRELELLIQSFPLRDPSRATASGHATNIQKKKTIITKKKESNAAKNQPPTVLLENLRHLLIEYRRELDHLSTDYGRVKTQNEAMTKENAQLKQVMTVKDKSLESSQQTIFKNSKELQKTRDESRELQNSVCQLGQELQKTHHTLQVEQKQSAELHEQLLMLAAKLKENEQASLGFLQMLHQQLQVLQVPFNPRQKGEQFLPSPTDWEELATEINEKISLILLSLHHAEEKVTILESNLVEREQILAGTQQSHEQQLTRLQHLVDGRSTKWQHEKIKMEKHYSQLLSEVHGRQKKTQALADQAWEKIRMTGTVQQGLEAECSQLQVAMTKLQTERDCLLAACALLSGAVYPLQARNTSLSTQRRILQRQLLTCTSLKQQLINLTSVLKLDESSHTVEDGDRKTGKPSLMLKFRSAVIAVMAANRLNSLTHNNCPNFIAYETFQNVSSCVVSMGVPQTNDICTSDQRTEQQKKRPEFYTLQWLTSGQVMSDVTTAMSDLVTEIHNTSSDHCKQRKVLHLAKTSFQKLIRNLATTYPENTCDYPGIKNDQYSTMARLGKGLQHALSKKGLKLQSTQYSSLEVLLSSLQQEIICFTERLHAAEVEKRDLRQELGYMQQQHQSHDTQSATIRHLESEKAVLSSQIEDSVERSRFEEVCAELSSALDREQQAQQLLNEQSQQLHELGLRLDAQLSQGGHNERGLAEALQGLSEAQLELRKQEQRSRQLMKQITQMESDKNVLQENVTDAETALHTVAKDRESLLTYMHSVELVVNNLKTDIALGTATSDRSTDLCTLLSSDLVPSTIGKMAPEMSECRNLVANFVELQRQLSGRVEALTGDITSQQHHIEALKHELNAVCQRQYNGELDHLRVGDMGAHGAAATIQLHQVNSSLENFKPLEADQTDVTGILSTPKTSGSKNIRSKGSSSKLHRTGFCGKQGKLQEQ